MKKRLGFRLLSLLPSVIGFIAALLLTERSVEVDGIYMRVVLFQIGGGFFGSLMGFRNISYLSMRPLVYIIPLVFVMNVDFALFLCGISFSAIVNKFIYADRILFSLLIGLTQPTLFLFVTILSLYKEMDVDYYFALSLVIATVILLLQTGYNDHSKGVKVSFSAIVISLVFGLTNYFSIFTYNNMNIVLIEKVYLATFSAVTLFYFREETVVGNFSLVKRLFFKYRESMDFTLVGLGLLCSWSEKYFLLSFFVGLYFHAKSSLLFRVIQVKDQRLKYLYVYLLLVPLTFFFQGSTMVVLWFLTHELLLRNVDEIDL